MDCKTEQSKKPRSRLKACFACANQVWAYQQSQQITSITIGIGIYGLRCIACAR